MTGDGLFGELLAWTGLAGSAGPTASPAAETSATEVKSPDVPPAPQPVAAAVPFIPTPLPFAPTRSTYTPAVEPVLVAAPKPVKQGPRFGQMHAEATARAARFVAAHAGESTPRAGTTPRARDHTASITSPLSPRGAAVLRATAAYGGPAPMPVAGPSPAASARAARVERVLAQGRAELEEERQRRTTARSRGESPDVVLALTLLLVVLVEVIGGVVGLGLIAGYIVLGLGFALDACARVLGTVAATRDSADFGTGWRWACALGGSPAVVLFAFNGDGSLVDADLAPLAGPIAAVATVCLIIGLAGIPAGI